MRESLRQEIRVRDNYRCGYCGITETDAGSELTIDHIQPQHQGGDDVPDNLIYCCHPCNEFKGKYWRTEPNLCLLNPLVDNMAGHFHEKDNGMLEALTERGANHLEVLHLNRPELIAHRQRDRYYAELELRQQEMKNLIATLQQTETANENRLRNRRTRRRRT